MSEQPLTYESVLALIRENSREMREEHREFRRSLKEQGAEFDRRMQETVQIAREAHKKISALGSRIGEIVENMVAGNIVEKFQAFGYEIIQCGPRVRYEYKKLGIRGEIDLFLEDGEVAILIEVKTSLETADVRKHIKQCQ